MNRTYARIGSRLGNAFFVLCTLMALGLLPARANSQQYEVLFIRALDPGGSIVGYDLNEAGQVTGTSYIRRSTRLGDIWVPHAFRYGNGTTVDLGTLGGAGCALCASGGVAINASGQIIGWSAVTGTNPPLNPPGFDCCNEIPADVEHAFLYSNGSMADLSVDAASNGISRVRVRDINDAGWITGQALFPDIGASNSDHALLYKPALGWMDLGTGGDCCLSGGTAINGSNQVTGYSDTFDDAFLYSNGSMANIGGQIEHASVGLDINASGQVTGWMEPGGRPHAFRYSAGATLDLGSLGGASQCGDLSGGLGINSSGQVVGYSRRSCSGDWRAFLWSAGAGRDGGTMIDLNRHIYPISLRLLIKLEEAVAITDKGWILANGHLRLLPNLKRTYLLKPR